MKKNVLLTGLGLVLAVCVVMVSRMACANDTDSRASAARERVTPVLNSFLGPCGARVPQAEGRGQTDAGGIL